MKYLKLFEEHAGADDSSPLKLAKMLGSKCKMEVTQIPIPSPPKRLLHTSIYYIHNIKEFVITDDSKKSFNSPEEMSEIAENLNFSTKSIVTIFNVIELERMLEKGLSREVYEWIAEDVFGEEVSFEELVERALKDPNAPKFDDKDFQILGIDKEKWRGVLHGKKYGV